jgi:glycosyltransferase involved in cell wall biosynthesis
VSVIVPARDCAATLSSTLGALARQELSEPFEVIVVDDGSEDATADVAGAAPGPVTLLRQDRLGPAAARHRGAAAAGGAALAFTDADCEPDPGWLAAGLRALEHADLVQGPVRPVAPPGPFDRTLWVVRESGLYEAANLFVRRELFDRLGGFAPWLEPKGEKALAEDVWFGWRARRAGARTAFCNDAIVYHAVFPRGGLAYVAERRRLRHFPEIAARVPEIRGTLFFGRRFLSRRTAAFDAALVAVAAAALGRSPLPLVAAVPYGVIVGRQALSWRSKAPAVVLAAPVADAVGLAALLLGSARARTLVL